MNTLPIRVSFLKWSMLSYMYNGRFTLEIATSLTPDLTHLLVSDSEQGFESFGLIVGGGETK